jgi:GlcNAc-P-P-Und epimerase
MGTHDVKNLIFYSSVAIYGTKNLPADENSQPAPESAYGASKLAAEDCIIKWLAEQKERIAFIVRPTVVIGARNTANMYSLIDQIYRGRYKFHFGKGDNIKSLAFVRSLVSFTLNLMMNNWKKSNQYEIFNYIDYPQLTIGQTIDIIHAELGIKQPRLRLPLSFAISIGKLFDFIIMLTGQNLPISSARIKKISMSTHFEPSKVKKMGFMKQDFVVDGLKEMIEWYLSMKNSG